MSRRDTDRDRGDREREREKHRENEGRRPPPPSSRSHEYFVPRDGIDREVITADICRYLGNDALVRPGSYENPQTRQVQQGYFITAYRNLTTAMIADLKVDSERWETERRAASGGRPINGTSSRDLNGFGRPSNTHPAPQYIGSRTQHEREYYGPSSETVPPPQGYSTPNASGPTHGQSGQEVYSGYPPPHQQQSSQNQGYVQPNAGPYGQQQSGGYPIHQESSRNYEFGAAYASDQRSVDPRSIDPRSVDPRSVDPRSIDPRSAGRVPVTQGGPNQRGGDVYSSPSGPNPSYPSDAGRNIYNPYPSQPPISSSNQYAQQPTDTFYGRAPVAPVSYDTAMDYSTDSRTSYQDASNFSSSQAPISSAFSQAPMSSMSSGFSQAPMSSMSSGFAPPPAMSTSGFSQPPVSASVNPTIATGAPTSRRGDREDRRREDRDSRHHRRP